MFARQVCFRKVQTSTVDIDDSGDDENGVSVDDLLAQAAADPDDDGNASDEERGPPLSAGSALAPANINYRNTLLGIFYDTAQAARDRLIMHLDSETNQSTTELIRQVHHCHRETYHCRHRSRLPHPKPPRANLLVSALVTKTRTGMTIPHLRPESTRMESVHILSYRYTTRRTWNSHYRQSMYQTRNREVVAQPWQEGVDLVRNSWYCLYSHVKISDTYCNYCHKS
jgi:hypothetical protein